MFKLGNVLSKVKVVQLKRITDGVWGQSPQNLDNFFGKISYFIAIGLHFARVQSHLKQLHF